MATKYQRVHVPKFCERCGKEEFEGVVWGRDATRHLRTELPHMGMVCDHCKPPVRTSSNAYWDNVYRSAQGR